MIIFVKRKGVKISMDKIARICWNTKDWKLPSGTEGKSREKYAYENNVGFGHEEWL